MRRRSLTTARSCSKWLSFAIRCTKPPGRTSRPTAAERAGRGLQRKTKKQKNTQKIATSPLSGRSFEGKRSLDYDRVATAAAIELGIENIIPQMSDEVKSAIVELISKGRSSLQPVTAWKNTKEAFHLIWDQKKKTPNTSRAAHKSASSGYQGIFNNIIPQTTQISNTSEKKNLNGPKSKDDTIYDFDEDELWSNYEETHALDEIDPETGWTVGEPFLYI